MRLALMALQQELDFDWTEIDIDRDTDLIRRFDTRVPVLELDGEEVCHYFLDDKALRACITSC